MTKLIRAKGKNQHLNNSSNLNTFKIKYINCQFLGIYLLLLSN